MQTTTNLSLKKPDYTDFADIQDINDNMDTLDSALHDTQNSVATFTSSDVADGSASAWTSVSKLTTGETHKSIFAKMSQMFKNVRYLYKMLGTTDISSIGSGTVTSALSTLNAKTLIEGDTAAFRVASSGADWTIRAIRTNGAYHSLYMTSNSMRYDYTDPSGTVTNVWDSLLIEQIPVTANGTATTTHTLSNAMHNYSGRAILAVCNGGSNGGRYITTVIPTSSTAVNVNWSGTLPTSGTIYVTFIYRKA